MAQENRTRAPTGLNALVATVSTPLGAPVIAGTRLRGGTANSARGAASFVAEAVHAAPAGCAGTIVVRMDSGESTPAWTGQHSPAENPQRGLGSGDDWIRALPGRRPQCRDLGSHPSAGHPGSRRNSPIGRGEAEMADLVLVWILAERADRLATTNLAAPQAQPGSGQVSDRLALLGGQLWL